MILASYIADGAEAYGVVKGDGVITMNNRFGGHAASLREALAGNLLPQIKEAASNGQADRKLSEIKFLPVIPNPEKILCVGINYKDHILKMAKKRGVEPAFPPKPDIGYRTNNALVAHDQDIVKPADAGEQFQYEGELEQIGRAHV